MRRCAVQMAAVLVSVYATGVGCSGDEQSKEAVAKALAERLTDKISFTNSTTQEGAPPPEHPFDAAFPQIYPVVAPFSLTAGTDFELQLHTTFTGATNGAIVKVVQANITDSSSRYIHVVEPLVTDVTDSIMTLVGQLLDDPELLGSAFSLQIGMREAVTGGVGGYVPWNFSIPGGEVSQCACVDAGASLTVNPDCQWPDATECTGWASVVLGMAGDYSPTNEEAIQSTPFPDGTTYSMGGECTITLHCP